MPGGASGVTEAGTSLSTKTFGYRNAPLFLSRQANRRASPAPAVLKLALPILDAAPGIPRLKKMQIAEALTLLFWTGGLRNTLAIVLEGVRFRLRLRTTRH